MENKKVVITNKELFKSTKKFLCDDKREFLSVQNTNRAHIKQIQSKSKFFSEPIKYKVTESEIIFEKPTPMYNGRTVKPQKMQSGWWSFQIVAEDVPMNKFAFDEDSNNECVIICYR